MRGEPLPKWKRDFLIKNAQFYERHAEVLDGYRLELDAFPASRRKFEWQAGPHRPLSETIMHFRPSGIRAKRPDYVPALVAITQTSIVPTSLASQTAQATGFRRITPREAAHLQGLPKSFEFVQSEPSWTAPVPQENDAASYKQMGNGVNVGAAYHVFREYVLSEHVRDDIPSHIVEAVEAAGANPDDNLRVSSALLRQLESNETAPLAMCA